MAVSIIILLFFFEISFIISGDTFPSCTCLLVTFNDRILFLLISTTTCIFRYPLSTFHLTNPFTMSIIGWLIVLGIVSCETGIKYLIFIRISRSISIIIRILNFVENDEMTKYNCKKYWLELSYFN